MGKSVLPGAPINSILIKATWSRERERKNHPWRVCKVSSNIRIIEDDYFDLSVSFPYNRYNMLTIDSKI